VTRLKKK